MRACVHACVRACVCAYKCACVLVCVCVYALWGVMLSEHMRMIVCTCGTIGRYPLNMHTWIKACVPVWILVRKWTSLEFSESMVTYALLWKDGIDAVICHWAD